MKNYLILIALLCYQASSLAEPPIVYNDPKSAVRALEKAYVENDVEAAVLIKNFQVEARLFWENVNPEMAEMEDIVNETAEVFELAFRKDMSENSFAIFAGAKCKLGKPKAVSENLVKMKEKCKFTNGEKASDIVYAYKDEVGWRVVTNPL